MAGWLGRKKASGANGDTVAAGEVCGCNSFSRKGMMSHIVFVNVSGLQKPLRAKLSTPLAQKDSGLQIGDSVKVRYRSANPYDCEIMELQQAAGKSLRAAEIENREFWVALEKLVAQSAVVLDRPKGSVHPKYPAVIYPVDYGFLEGTASMDGGGIDVWKGSLGYTVCGIICTVDLLKKDSEIKILIGCSEQEKRLALDVHNNSEFMKGILIDRKK